jgi:hypothetical protein
MEGTSPCGGASETCRHRSCARSVLTRALEGTPRRAGHAAARCLPLRRRCRVLFAIVFSILLLFNQHARANPGCSADLNGDGVVNVADMLLLFDMWGICAHPEGGLCHADLDGDGAINVSDLLVMMDQWGPCPAPATCIGHCAGQTPSGCWCDYACHLAGDCCDDVCDACGHCAGPDSCLGRCGKESPEGCSCDEACLIFDDCCDDYCSICQTCPTNYCLDHCGEQSPVGCWCDALCVVFGDCCTDACANCGHCE